MHALPEFEDLGFAALTLCVIKFKESRHASTWQSSRMMEVIDNEIRKPKKIEYFFGMLGRENIYSIYKKMTSICLFLK